MSEPEFHGDRPIKAASEDRFGFTALASRIADSLTSQAARSGFVFGLEGKWGSGKSSLLALTIAQLRAMDETKVAVVEFRPWLIGDRDQLLSALFEDLAKAIAGLEHAAGDATNKTKLAAKRVLDEIRGFTRHLRPLGKLTGALGMLVPGATELGKLLENVAEAADLANGPSLVAQKEKLAEALLALDCRIVIAIDDVDRLEPKEVAEILRLVRSVADFPSVSYLLCYDAKTLAKAIETGTGVEDGHAYLEKIVQTEVAVPKPESFALRRWFSTELQSFAKCTADRAPHLQHVIDVTGGRVLENPRAVVRVLDSLRVYWPSLKERVDLADLVWLRMIAIGSPNFYRWAEDYLVDNVTLSSGRARISDQERNAMGKRMDEALKRDGLDWEEHWSDLERHLPSIHYEHIDSDKDGRLFSHIARSSPWQDDRDKRLASPNHTRLYFTLIEPPDSVTDRDIDDLLAAAHGGMDAVTLLIIDMGKHRGDAGATKAERLLDQLRSIDRDVLGRWPIETLIIGLSNAADELAKDVAGDDWGHPRIWHLAKALLRQIRLTLPTERYDAAIKTLFESSTSLGFLSYLLRDEIFGHGFYGNRPDPNDRLTSSDGFTEIRLVMLARYGAHGLDQLMEGQRATNMLYAWSQAGGRDALIEQVATQAGNDAWLLRFVQKLYGLRSPLSLNGLDTFFKSPASIVRRVHSLLKADPDNQAARGIILSIKSAIHFDGGDFEATLRAWEAQEAGNNGADGTSPLTPTSPHATANDPP